MNFSELSSVKTLFVGRVESETGLLNCFLKEKSISLPSEALFAASNFSLASVNPLVVAWSSAWASYNTPIGTQVVRVEEAVVCHRLEALRLWRE